MIILIEDFDGTTSCDISDSWELDFKNDKFKFRPDDYLILSKINTIDIKTDCGVNIWSYKYSTSFKYYKYRSEYNKQ